jgi:hypothetical protein
MARIIENFEIGQCIQARTGSGPKMLVSGIQTTNLGYSSERIQVTYWNEFTETWVEIWMHPAMVKILPEDTAAE